MPGERAAALHHTPHSDQECQLSWQLQGRKLCTRSQGLEGCVRQRVDAMDACFTPTLCNNTTCVNTLCADMCLFGVCHAFCAQTPCTFSSYTNTW
jgi:hypothetical protein